LTGVPIQMPSETPNVCSRIRSNSAFDLSDSLAETVESHSAQDYPERTARDAAVAITARVSSLLAIIERKRPI